MIRGFMNNYIRHGLLQFVIYLLSSGNLTENDYYLS
jgi:hypothetical protein